MLVLSRRENETIRIGEEVRVTVLAVSSGGRVKLAIEAPGQEIHREEIWLKIKEQNTHENQ